MPLFGVSVVGQPYAATAVVFDGTNDYLTRGAGLTGAADGKVGLFFAPIKFNGGDAVEQAIWRSTAYLAVTRVQTTNKLQVALYNSGGPAAFDCTSSTYAIVDDDAYHMLLIAWNAATSTLQVYDGDTAVTMAAGTRNDLTIFYQDTNYGVGAAVNGASKANANIGPFYLNTAETLDISVEANRRKFFSAAGVVENMGTDGSAVTGTAPIVFFDGEVDAWHTTKGTGGGFTENGALTDGGTI